MRHIYIRGFLALVWLIAAVISVSSGNFKMTALYLVIFGIFLYSAYVMWKKEKGGNGGQK